MIKYAIAGAKRLIGSHRLGRELRILPDDTFLVSYPKSGNTWARLLISNLLSPDKPADLWTINRLVPEIEGVTKRQLVRMPRPRIIKSHFAFDPRYPRVIYIVRDPRDVVISEYHYQRKTRQIHDGYSMEEYVTRFIEGKTCPEDGSWGQHVASWILTRGGASDFLLICYETLLSDMLPQLGRIAEFLHISATPEQLKEVAELSSVDRMRQLESSQSNASSLMKRGRRDVPFVRSAKSGNWKMELSPVLVARIEAAWGPLLRYLGYESASLVVPSTFDPTELAIRKH